MTHSIDSYIKELIKDNMAYSDCDKDFDEMVDDSLHELFNNYDDNWENYGKPTLDEFMSVQYAAFDYLDGCDSLDLISQEVRDWKWWFNIYAMSREWGGDWDEFRLEWWIETYEEELIAFQSLVRGHNQRWKCPIFTWGA